MFADSYSLPLPLASGLTAAPEGQAAFGSICGIAALEIVTRATRRLLLAVVFNTAAGTGAGASSESLAVDEEAVFGGKKGDTGSIEGVKEGSELGVVEASDSWRRETLDGTSRNKEDKEN